jgi:vitamin-K-epoxide reductase (warfarin-sensitive)
MKYPLLILAICGIIASSLALREHYRESGDAPCSINERWDCGIVNHSPYAMLGGVLEWLGLPSLGNAPILRSIPIGVVGIAGYILMAALAFSRFYRLLLLFTLSSLAFSLCLAKIEKDVLGVWCIYCVISLGIISLMSLLNLIAIAAQAMRKPSTT